MFGIGMGPSTNEKNQYNLLSDIAGFGKNQGEKAVTQSNDFWSSILSGDMDKITKVLGPQIKAITGQAQQTKQTASQFGTRSGGTNAFMQTVDDKAKASISDMVASLTGTAASSLGSQGLSLIGQGIQSGTSAFDAAQVMHDQNAAKWGDIFKSISNIAGGALTGAGVI